MLLDRLRDADRYAALHPLFPGAIAALRDPSHAARPPGRYEIDGGRLQLIVDDARTGAADERRFESHRRYIDIQLVLAGPEIMEWAPVESLNASEPYHDERDVVFYHDPAGSRARLLVRAGEIAVFWPSDGHKPGCEAGDGAGGFRKLVMKVAVGG